jgi:hypothetical protein
MRIYIDLQQTYVFVSNAAVANKKSTNGMEESVSSDLGEHTSLTVAQQRTRLSKLLSSGILVDTRNRTVCTDICQHLLQFYKRIKSSDVETGGHLTNENVVHKKIRVDAMN